MIGSWKHVTATIVISIDMLLWLCKSKLYIVIEAEVKAELFYIRLRYIIRVKSVSSQAASKCIFLQLSLTSLMTIFHILDRSRIKKRL